jgi:hypothetical protein
MNAQVYVGFSFGDGDGAVAGGRRECRRVRFLLFPVDVLLSGHFVAVVK